MSFLWRNAQRASQLPAKSTYFSQSGLGHDIKNKEVTQVTLTAMEVTSEILEIF